MEQHGLNEMQLPYTASARVKVLLCSLCCASLVLGATPAPLHAQTPDGALDEETPLFAPDEENPGSASPKADAEPAQGLSVVGILSDIGLLAVQDFAVNANARGLSLSWTAPVLPDRNPEAYVLYRSAGASSTPERFKKLDGSATAYLDESVEPETTYRYAISAVYDGEEASRSSVLSRTVASVAAPASAAASKKSGSASMRVSWKAATGVDGYQVQYASNVLFRSAKTLPVKSPESSSASIGGLSKSAAYFARTRSYKKYGTKTYYSSWTYSGNALKTRTLALSVSKTTVTVKKKGKKKKRKVAFEIKTRAKQKLLRYDTVQGSCTDGTYAYYILYNRNVEKCKIAKVKLSTMKVKKVSKALALGHGNDMTYNKHAKRIAVINRTVHKKRIALVDPKTLKVKRKVDVNFTSVAIPGLSAANAKKISAICNIAYDAATRTYVVRAVGLNRYMVLDENFVPVGAIKPQYSPGQVMQGLEVSGDHILVSESASASGQYNIIVVYDRSGRHITTMRLRGSMEIESIYFVGNKLYAAYYDSSPTVKKVKGVKRYVFSRNNYVYRVKGY